MKKRLIGLLLIFTLIISLFAVPDMAEAATKSYLVLIETKEGKWTAYKDLAYANGDYQMVKAYSTSIALGLTYKNNDKTLTIQNGKKKLTLTKNSKSYKYYNGSSTSKKTAKYKTYAAKIANKSTYVAHYATLSNLSVYTQYYTGSKATDYKILGYKGVICYSTVGKITSLPNIKNVVNTDGKKLNTDTTTENNNDNSNNNDKTVGYKGTVTIGKTKIPKLDGFSNLYKDPTGHWGADVTGNTPLEDSIDEFSVELKKEIAKMNIEDNPGENADIKVNDSVIIAQISGDSMLSPLRLYKTDYGYRIYISNRLSKNTNPNEADYSKVLQDTLYLYTAIISSEPKILYDSLYKDFEEDAFISETSWTTIGDCKVQCTGGKGYVNYLIKAK